MKKTILVFLLLFSCMSWPQNNSIKKNSIEEAHLEDKVSDNISKLLITFLVFEFAIIMFLLFRTSRLKNQNKDSLNDKNRVLEQQQYELNSIESRYSEIKKMDPQTRLKNIQYLDGFIKKIITQKPQYSWHLILIDIDSFKKINYDYDRKTGDEVLVLLAELLKTITQPEDKLVRWGGGEFLWLVKQTSSIKIQNLCSDLQQKISDHEFKAQGHTLKITCTLGFTNFPIMYYKVLDWEWAIKLATHALSRAKETGSNQCLGLILTNGKEFDYSTSAKVPEMTDFGVLTLIEKR